jgi:hypothetical protein
LVPAIYCNYLVLAKRYGLEFSWQSSFTDTAVNVISKSAQFTEGEGQKLQESAS